MVLCKDIFFHQYYVVFILINPGYFQMIDFIIIHQVKSKSNVNRQSQRLCRNTGLNHGPLDLQSNALPTELFRQTNQPCHECQLDNEQVNFVPDVDGI